ncbi:MAG: HAD hydrolase family protein, partial [Candidatus Levybacteria bacterium]|nr:HAD hydrolase family protein [Candidatus Levybacteria bacterium]
MKYKAIVFDLDGTVVPSVMDGIPSVAVIEAIHKIKKEFKLSTASARAVQYCRNIWKALSIEDPCVINGGSQIIDPKTEKIIW